METIEQRITQFAQQWEYYYYPDRNEKCKPLVDQFNQQLDNLVESINDTKKKEKAKLLYLKGKILDILPYYQKSSQQLLNKSIKLNPANGDCWNCLAHVLFKKKDYEGAKQAIQMALDCKGKNKVSLRYKSVLLRTQGKLEQQRRKNIQQSVKIIKDALLLDMKDPLTWYFLGNAYFSNFFANFKKFDELQNSVKAYNQAQKYFKHRYPDLYYNRGNVLMHMQSYSQAVDDFIQVNGIDPTMNSKQRVQSILKRVQFTRTSFDRLNQLKKNKLDQMLKNIPNSVKNAQNYQIASIKKLNERGAGQNKNKMLSAKIITKLTSSNDVPISFLVMDSQGNFLTVSIYNTDESINDKLKKDELITVKDPQLKKIDVNGFTYFSVQVFEIIKLFINGKCLSKNQFVPNIVYSETFEK